MRVADNWQDTHALAPESYYATDFVLAHVALADGNPFDSIDVLYAESNGPDGSAAPRLPLCWRVCEPEARYTDHRDAGPWETEHVETIANLSRELCDRFDFVTRDPCALILGHNEHHKLADGTAFGIGYTVGDAMLWDAETRERAERQAQRETRQERRAGMMRS